MQLVRNGTATRLEIVVPTSGSYSAHIDSCNTQARCPPRRHRPRFRTITSAQAADMQLQSGDDENEVEAGYGLRHGRPWTTPCPLLDAEDVMRQLYRSVHKNAEVTYRSFYSSVLGGIVTDPAFMIIPADDHMVHRGHSVFDTATLVQGYLYQLEPHLDRFYVSAQKAGIEMPFTRRQIRRIILETAAASTKLNGHLRYWVSAGRGDFALASRHCQSTFYCVTYVAEWADIPDGPQSSGLHGKGSSMLGWRVKTSPVPVKAPYFSTLKSTNYLPNALCVDEAQSAGLDQGVFVDEDGYVVEGGNWNLGFVDDRGTLVVPPFDRALQGITMTRIMELTQKLLDEGEMDIITGVEQRPVSLREAYSMREAIATSSSLPVMPIIYWDGQQIGSGQAGPGALALRMLMLNDFDTNRNDPYTSGQHTEVPYGFVTKML